MSPLPTLPERLIPFPVVQTGNGISEPARRLSEADFRIAKQSIGNRMRRLERKHVLMLALALEVLWFGFNNADRYRPPGITIEQTIAKGHVIT